MMARVGKIKSDAQVAAASARPPPPPDMGPGVPFTPAEALAPDLAALPAAPELPSKPVVVMAQADFMINHRGVTIQLRKGQSITVEPDLLLSMRQSGAPIQET